MDTSNLWTLTYRHGLNSTHVKNFSFTGTIVQAQERARQHCAVMKIKYIDLSTFVSDLDAEEKEMLGKGNPTPARPAVVSSK